MARRLLAALALAHGATALFEGFVDVLVRVDIQVSPSVFGGVVQAAGDGGADACDTAGTVVDSCYDSGVLDATAVVADARSCLCCFGTTAISAVYSKCSTYAAGVGASSVKTGKRAVSGLSLSPYHPPRILTRPAQPLLYTTTSARERASARAASWAPQRLQRRCRPRPP